MEYHEVMPAPLTDFTRAMTRPIVTILFTMAIVIAVLQEIDLPPWFLSLAIPCIVWWFGERAYTHSKERNGKLRKVR